MNDSELAFFLSASHFPNSTPDAFPSSLSWLTLSPVLQGDIFMPDLQSKQLRFKDGEGSGQVHTDDKSGTGLADFGLLIPNPFNNVPPF